MIRTRMRLLPPLLSFVIVFGISCTTPRTRATNDDYLIGVGSYDMTGPAADVILMGYANPQQNAAGIHFRLRARAFIVAESSQGARFAFVNLDAGMASQLVTIKVLEKLRSRYGDLYNEENVAISGTHTHAGPGGYLQYMLYSLSSLGFVQQSFDAIVKAIEQSISQAHNNLRPGFIYINTGDVENAGINRSPSAYLFNSKEERARYPKDVDTQMTLLKFVDGESGKSIGAFNWFATHGTSMSRDNKLISGDNKGAAARFFEDWFRYGTKNTSSTHTSYTNISQETLLIDAYSKPKAMKVHVDSSRLIKPFYERDPPSITDYIPLSVFDKVTFNAHIAVIYAYRPPTPPNAKIEQGLQKALSEYREWAGRLGRDDRGDPFILLNDEGVRFVEASVNSTLAQAMLLKPSAALLSLHPSLNGVEELLQVQLTRFACGSLVVGFTSHHQVADGQATSNFLVAWGQACRGLDMIPRPFHDRSIFVPRNPPKIEFDHRGVEYISQKLNNTRISVESLTDDIVVQKVHFTLEFLAKLKAKASEGRGGNRPYSTFESLVAHLWRAITKTRGLNSIDTTQVRLSVNGRSRLNPRVPNEYFGNAVLWAFPSAEVKDLLQKPLSFAAKLIHDAVTRVNNNYFKSFIDFASSKVREEDLMPTADMTKSALCPNIEVDSWLRFPFYDLDFGCGCPYIFLPSYFPTEGMLFLLPSFIGDGSIDVFVPLFENNLDSFKEICYSLH